MTAIHRINITQKSRAVPHNVRPGFDALAKRSGAPNNDKQSTNTPLDILVLIDTRQYTRAQNGAKHIKTTIKRRINKTRR